MTVGVGRVVGVPSAQTFADGTTWTPLPGEYDLCCDACGATWVGYADAECGWCVDTEERLRAETRRMLLFPEWLADEHGPIYDELDEIDRRIWDRTRGIDRGEGSRRAWGERLGRAVESGLISEAEADAALARVERR